jgi:serine phosphatase RsbU (regulator of sigma subunit)
VIDNLHRTAREHSNSVALQQALLTAPPQVPGLQIVIRYVPATTGNEIGGDWYDAFLQPDGTPVLAIGDVVGHDIYAAAAMGQLRGVIRTVGYTTSATPAEILTRADAAARGLRVEVLATTVIARIEGVGADVATLGWSNAGHPPPILITADGPRLLDAAPDRPLGIGRRADRARHDRCVEFRHGDILLLYTDGLIERRDEDLDAALDRLIATLAQAPATDLEALCDLVLTDHGDGARDDIALLAVRVVDP